jgi:hypothetical protein
VIEIEVKMPPVRETAGYFHKNASIYQIDGTVTGILMLDDGDHGDRYVAVTTEEAFYAWERLTAERARLYGDLYGTCIVCTGKAPKSGLHKECEVHL